MSCCSLGPGEQSVAGGVQRGMPESQECPGWGAQAAFGRAVTSSVPLQSVLSSCLACRARAAVRLGGNGLCEGDVVAQGLWQQGTRRVRTVHTGYSSPVLNLQLCQMIPSMMQDSC